MSELDNILKRAKEALEFEDRGDALDKQAIKDVFTNLVSQVMQEIANGQSTAIIQDKYWQARQSGINLVETPVKKAIGRL
jgi:hypothetical protein